MENVSFLLFMDRNVELNTSPSGIEKEHLLKFIDILPPPLHFSIFGIGVQPTV